MAAALARKLGRDSIDLDSFISEREGRTAAEIIEQNGETAFREIETQALRDALEGTAARVIALGGGAWTIEANRALVGHHGCFSVWLDTPFELCWKRITANPNPIRPLAPNRESAQRLHKSRHSSYLLAQLRVDATKEPAEIVKAITRSLS